MAGTRAQDGQSVITRQLLLLQLSERKKNRGRPRLRYKEVAKHDMKLRELDTNK